MPVHNFERPRGRVEEIVVQSRVLRDNALGDPFERVVAVYLPGGYDESDADYPLFVDLAAFTSSGLKRLAWTAFGESVPQRLDRLIARGLMGPVVLAFPDGFTSLGGNQYVDSPILGRWETFVAQELPAALEAHFRVRRDPRQRAIYGKSSGGYGALVQGMRHASRWGAVACHSGDMGFEWVCLRDFPKVLDALAPGGGDVEDFVRRFAENPKVRGDHLHIMMMLAMAASYAPDLEAPLGVRLPVDPYTCELDTDAWSRWLAHDPVHMIDDPACRENLASLRGLFFDCGRRDQYLLHYGARTLARKLDVYGIEHVYDEFDDDHSSIDYRLDVSLPWLYQAIMA